MRRNYIASVCSTFRERLKAVIVTNGCQFHKYYRFRLTKKQLLLMSMGLVISFVAIIVSILYLGQAHAIPSEKERVYNAIYSNGAISIDGPRCAKIGYDVIKRNGSVVDAAIAALFCNGIVCPHSMGIGGGFGMIYYRKSDGKAFSLNAREWAPEWSNYTMFNGNQNASTFGPLSMAVPGEIMGYWEMKKTLGSPSVTWESIIQPSIDMARNGIQVSKHLAKTLKEMRDYIFMSQGLKEIFVDPGTNDILQEGDVYKREKFADTLEKISENPMDFYKGQMAEAISREIKMEGGIITTQDMNSYKVEWMDPVGFEFQDGLKVHSISPPFGGANLIYILNILDHYPKDELKSIFYSEEPALWYHRLTEAFKWAYGVRSRLGDPNDEQIASSVEQLIKEITSPEYGQEAFKLINDSFTVNNASFYGGDFVSREDHGTSQLSIIGPNGDAISVTSTINTHFGSKVVGQETGIIYNNEMDDFSSPNITNYFGLKPSPNNFIRPKKRPVSSMSPSIFVDHNGSVVLSIGAAGGSRITTATAYTSLLNLWLDKSIDISIDMRRIHHQLLPMELHYEKGFDGEILDELKSRRHVVVEDNPDYSVVQAVARTSDFKYHAFSDTRKDGEVYGE
ncbi:glutathione hydrolase 1 proenzyme isoform X2 [Lepeophtheirus salmonis]|uniref:glutathione hydrolase 1 proenzyme isoform X2 n=1 Tax=Lepeophtheirus salmonis TaxID=72036 RepID=UPI001AE54C91|nr:glutathione hydrolase 1 proenzyme-like isoform X2 [Lepeophtheirus salmonis]